MALFVLNGDQVTVGDHEHLLAALRDELDVLSPKDGCPPTGQGGCCTVIIDGKAQVACQTSLAKVEDKAVTASSPTSWPRPASPRPCSTTSARC